MKPASILGLLVVVGALAVAALEIVGPTGGPHALTLPSGRELAAGVPREPAFVPHRTDRTTPTTRAPRDRAKDEARNALERSVTALARRLTEGDCDARFDDQARSYASALIERHGRPAPASLAPWLEHPDTTAAAAVLAGHLGWTELPPAALAALDALWNDVRLEGAGAGLTEADAAFARALAITPARMRFEPPARRDGILGALVDPSPLRRRLARVAAGSAEPIDAVKRLARLAVILDESEYETSRLGFALRQCLDRVRTTDALDPMTLEIVRERADAWSNASLARSLARFTR